MAGIIGFLMGVAIGVILSLITVGALVVNRDNEVYMEGYLAGKTEGLDLAEKAVREVLKERN